MLDAVGSAGKKVAASEQDERGYWQLQTGATRYELEEIRIQQVPSEAFGRGLILILLAPPCVGIFGGGWIVVRFVHE